MEAVALLATPCVLVVCAVTGLDQTALLSFAVVLASLGVFFANFEASAPRLRDIMPTAVLAALAAAGRILFAPIPDFKPVSAIAIIAGVAFGRNSGFMVGSLAALASNFFFGQGAWTPWQMYAWGLVGYVAGLIASIPAARWKKGEVSEFSRDELKMKSSGEYAHGIAPNSQAETNDPNLGSPKPGCLFDLRPTLVYIYGFVACLGYGFILNAWSILSFYHAQASGLAGILMVYATALPFDIAHGIATVLFLVALYKPWIQKLKRIRRKFGLA